MTEWLIPYDEAESQRIEEDFVVRLHGAARALVVRDRGEHEAGQLLLREIALRERTIKDFFIEPKRLAHAAHKALTTRETAMLAPLAEARSIVTKRCAAYEWEERRRADEERRRQEEQARKEEQDRLAALAALAETEGRQAEAEAILDEALATPGPSIMVEPELGKVGGVSMRETWRATVTDLLALVRHIAANPGLIGLVEPNASALNAMARAQKDLLQLPGVRAVKETSSAVRL